MTYTRRWLQWRCKLHHSISSAKAAQEKIKCIQHLHCLFLDGASCPLLVPIDEAVAIRGSQVPLCIPFSLCLCIRVCVLREKPFAKAKDSLEKEKRRRRSKTKAKALHGRTATQEPLVRTTAGRRTGHRAGEEYKRQKPIEYSMWCVCIFACVCVCVCLHSQLPREEGRKLLEQDMLLCLLSATHWYSVRAKE